MQWRRIVHSLAMAIAGLRYVPDFVAADEETELLARVDAEPWLDDLERRVQHYGYRYDYKARKVSRSMFVGPLPALSHAVSARLVAMDLMSAPPDQLIVNEYVPGQGISPHVDCVPCFGPRIVTVSLGSQCEMDFDPVNGGERVQLMLEPRSALLIADEARYRWRHSIRGRLSDRGRARTRRVSLAFRNVIVE
jgi:alkylated DNA repair dioxygenase AlkB